MAVDTRYVTHDKWTGLTATQLTYPNGRQVASTYDALYRRNGVKETSGGASIAAWQFFGNRTATVALGNGITNSFINNAQTNSAVQPSVPNPAWGDKTTDRLGYDGSGRLIAKRFLPSGSTTALVGFTTAYDPSSNKLFERALHAESRSALYPSYDSMDRLVEYQRGVLASGGASVATPITLPGTDNQRTYNLDGLGNWSTTVYTPEGGSSTTETRTHNKLNEILSFGVLPASTSVLYDHGNNAGGPYPSRGNGNIANDGTRIYAYDALNRLTTVSSTASGTPQVAAYTYDTLGRRVLKVTSNGGIAGTVANATYRYLFDGQRIIEELLYAGSSYSTLRQFIWGQYIDELIQLTVPTTTTIPPLTTGTYYPLQDLLYRTMATTNASAALVEAYDYDAYGNTLMYSGPGTDGLWFTDDDVTTLQPACEYLFTGRQYDPETEIYFYRARYYLQALARFAGRDPIGYAGGINLYQAFTGNPISLTDPSGLAGTICCPNGTIGWANDDGPKVYGSEYDCAQAYVSNRGITGAGVYGTSAVGAGEVAVLLGVTSSTGIGAIALLGGTLGLYLWGAQNCYQSCPAPVPKVIQESRRLVDRATQKEISAAGHRPVHQWVWVPCKVALCPPGTTEIYDAKSKIHFE